MTWSGRRFPWRPRGFRREAGPGAEGRNPSGGWRKPRLPSKWRPFRGTVGWLLALVASVAAAGALLFAASTWQDYRNSLDIGWAAAERAASLLKEQAGRALDAGDLITGRMADSAQTHGLDWFRGDGWNELQQYLQTTPAVGSLWVFDADANLVATSLDRDPPPDSFAGQEDYPLLRSGRVETSIRPLRRTRPGNIWSFGYSRAIFADGDFIGVAQASVHLDHFRRLYDSLDLGPDAALALYRTDDGTTIMRWPLPAAGMAPGPPGPAVPVVDSPTGRHMAAGADGSTFLTVWQTASDRPVVATVSVSRDRILAPFRQRLVRNAGLFALAALAVVLLTVAALSASRWEQRQEREMAEGLVERERLLAAVRASEERLASALRGGQFGVYDSNLKTGEIEWDATVRRLWGVPADLPVTRAVFRSGIHPEDLGTVETALARAFDPDGPHHYEAEFRVISRADGTTRWVHAEGDVRFVGRRPARLVGTIVDCSRQKDAEERQQTLMAELDHRVKNILAVVQAMARQSLRDADEATTRGFIGRLEALAQAHSLLSANRWQGANLRRLAADSLRPYGGEDAARVTLDGPDVSFNPRAAQAMALTLHELATNAAKYGALSTPGGEVGVAWQVQREDGGRCLQLVWQERGGPQLTAPPMRKGFGSRLIEHTVTYELQGSAVLDFQADGLVATLRLPFDALGASANPGAAGLPRRGEPGSATAVRTGAPAGAAAGVPPGAESPLTGKRILVVEDQHLIANELAELLTGAGCIVVGPVATLAQAWSLALHEPLDAAVLDINLDGEMVWPAAEALQARGLPYLFATGYADIIDLPGNLKAPRVGKPIDGPMLLASLSGALTGCAHAGTAGPA